MTPELLALTIATLLQVFQFFLMAVPTNIELKPGKTLSPRDRDRMNGEIQDLVSPRTARLIRAWENHFESLLLFAIACLVITFSDQTTMYTVGFSYLYVLARLFYIPAYAFGWVPWRSLFWMVGFFSIAAMLFAALI